MKRNEPSFIIVGKDSFIGKNIANILKKSNFELFQTTRRKEDVSKKCFYLNLAKPCLAWELPDVDIAIICVGITSIATCEKNTTSWYINVTNTLNLIENLINQKTFVIFISSSSVFDGKKTLYKIDDFVNPQTEYGRQKVEVENSMIKNWPENSAVLRLGKVLGPGLQELFRSWFINLTSDKTIYPYNNLYFSPVSIEAVTNALIYIALRKKSGIAHLSGIEDIAYSEVAQWLGNKLNCKTELIQPIDCKTDNKFVKNTLHSSLATEQHFQTLGPIGWDCLIPFLKKKILAHQK